MKNVAGNGGRWLDVSPERFPRWIENFAERHGGAAPAELPLGVAVGSGRAVFTAPDGAVAECHPPFPESLLPESMPPLAGAAAPGDTARAIAAHAMTPRTTGVLLVRLGGYAAGVFTGYPPALTRSKTGARPVHGRSAAGGWSQQRFAPRREKQANEALRAAADAAVSVFGGRAAGLDAVKLDAIKLDPIKLDAVVLGGDKRAIAELRDDPRLARYLAMATDRFLAVPDPKRAVLAASPRLFLAVRIWLTEPGA